MDLWYTVLLKIMEYLTILIESLCRHTSWCLFVNPNVNLLKVELLMVHTLLSFIFLIKFVLFLILMAYYIYEIMYFSEYIDI